MPEVKPRVIPLPLRFDRIAKDGVKETATKLLDPVARARLPGGMILHVMMSDRVLQLIHERMTLVELGKRMVSRPSRFRLSQLRHSTDNPRATTVREVMEGIIACCDAAARGEFDRDKDAAAAQPDPAPRIAVEDIPYRLKNISLRKLLERLLEPDTFAHLNRWTIVPMLLSPPVLGRLGSDVPLHAIACAAEPPYPVETELDRLARGKHPAKPVTIRRIIDAELKVLDGFVPPFKPGEAKEMERHHMRRIAEDIAFAPEPAQTPAPAEEKPKRKPRQRKGGLTPNIPRARGIRSAASATGVSS